MDQPPETFASLYLRRLTPEYGQAFDRAAKAFLAQDRPALAVLSSVVYALELLKRCPGPLHLAGTGAFDPGPFAAASQAWAWGPLTTLDLAEPGAPFESMLWAEPEIDSAEIVGARLRKRSAAKADLWVITSGPLRRFLPAWQAQPRPAVRPLDPGQVSLMLRRTGWRVQDRTAFHGPRSIAWTFLARAAARLKKPDWEDRCTFAMRTHYREPGWLWPLAPLALIHARPA